MNVFAAALLLFLVIDPIGNIPAFLSILNNVPAEKRKIVLSRELLIALATLVLFLFFGKYILTALQISQASLGAAGGIENGPHGEIRIHSQ